MPSKAMTLFFFLCLQGWGGGCKKFDSKNELKKQPPSSTADEIGDKVLFEEGEIVVRQQPTEIVDDTTGADAKEAVVSDESMPSDEKSEEGQGELTMDALPDFSPANLEVLYFHEDRVYASDRYSRATVFSEDLSFSQPASLGLALPPAYAYFNFADQYLWQVSETSVAVTTQAFQVPIEAEKLTMAAAKLEDELKLGAGFEILGLEQTRLFMRDEFKILLSTFDGAKFYHSRFENTRLAKDLPKWAGEAPLATQIIAAGSTLGEDGLYFALNQGIAVYKFVSFEKGYTFLKSYSWQTLQSFEGKKVGMSVSVKSDEVTLASPQYVLDKEGLKTVTLILKKP